MFCWRREQPSNAPRLPSLTTSYDGSLTILNALQRCGRMRVGLGAPDVPKAVKALQERGVVFVDHGAVQPSDKGALTQVYLGGVTFELVVSHIKS